MQIINLEGLDPSKLQVERLSHYELLAVSAEGYVHLLHLVFDKLQAFDSSGDFQVNFQNKGKIHE